MKNKKVSFTLPEEDIRSVATILTSRSIGRFTNKFGTCNQKLQESLATGDNKEILTSINRLINHMHDSVKELKQIHSVVNQIPELEDEPEKK
tara:strand:- start:2062 stop:2337 length:276 start_codon:yes stop_codon:yes gene_type:complete